MVARNLGSTGLPGGADSAGVPWEGRHFEESTWTDDDGEAPERLLEALRRFRSGELGQADVVDAVRDSRLLVPLIAELGESGQNAHGHLVDKSQELSIVTVAGPDGRTVLPVFTSAEAMQRWNATARPVPAQAERVAVAAASENTDLVVIDPTADTEYVLRRSALAAIAQSLPWVPSYLDEEVLDAFVAAARTESVVSAIAVAPGDPGATLAGPEVIVRLTLAPGLDRSELTAVTGRLQALWSADAIIASRVDSLGLKLVAAAS
jgi:hypothetical protein